MPAPKKENLFVNLAFNLVVPGLILSDTGRKTLAMLTAEHRLLLALVFPVAYFTFDYVRRRQANVISIFGFVGTLLSGAVGLMKLDPFWFAVKEATFPVIIGLGLYVSQWAGRPLVKAFVWNESVMHTDRISAAAAERGRTADVDRLFSWCTRRLAPAFLASSAAHYALARIIVTAHPEFAADDFNSQLARFNFIAWPGILLPSMIYLVWLMLKFMKDLREISGLTEDELYRG